MRVTATRGSLSLRQSGASFAGTAIHNTPDAYQLGSKALPGRYSHQAAVIEQSCPFTSWTTSEAGTAVSLYNKCFGHQRCCPHVRSSLLQGITTFRMQWLAPNCTVIASRMCLHQVFLRAERRGLARQHLQDNMCSAEAFCFANRYHHRCLLYDYCCYNCYNLAAAHAFAGLKFSPFALQLFFGETLEFCVSRRLDIQKSQLCPVLILSWPGQEVQRWMSHRQKLYMPWLYGLHHLSEHDMRFFFLKLRWCVQASNKPWVSKAYQGQARWADGPDEWAGTALCPNANEALLLCYNSTRRPLKWILWLSCWLQLVALHSMKASLGCHHSLCMTSASFCYCENVFFNRRMCFSTGDVWTWFRAVLHLQGSSKANSACILATAAVCIAMMPCIIYRKFVLIARGICWQHWHQSKLRWLCLQLSWRQSIHADNAVVGPSEVRLIQGHIWCQLGQCNWEAINASWL